MDDAEIGLSSEAAMIRMNAHKKIFYAALEASEASHVIATPGERKTRPKCKIVIAVRSPGVAQKLMAQIDKIVEETKIQLKEGKYPTNFEYKIKYANVCHEDILLTEGKAYKQTKHTGFQLLEHCLAIFDQIIEQYPSREELTKTHREDFKKYYDKNLSDKVQPAKSYYIIQDTGKNYRMTYFGIESEKSEPHRIQASIGDVFIMCGIGKMNIRSSKQKIRTDKTKESEYIYRSEYFSIKPKK